MVALATAWVESAEASPKPSLPDCFETPGQETGCEPAIALRKCVGLPLCGFVTTSSDPAAEPCDGVLLVCRSSRLRRCWHPVAFSSQVGTAPAARTLLGTHGRLVAHAGRTAAFGSGSMPASLGSALQGHRHQRPARVPVPRLAVRARRRRGRDPATGGGGAAAPVGVPAGAAHGRGLRHGLDLPGAATAGLRSRPSPSSTTPGSTASRSE